jgi:hypothetical protein
MIATACPSMALLALLLGCHAQPVDLTAGAANGTSSAVLREADDCWLRSVDGRAVPNRGLFGSYRSFNIVAGRHTLTIEYELTETTGDWRSGPMDIPVELQPDHRYVLKSNRSGLFSSTAGLTRGAVKPSVVDEESKQTVGASEDHP